MGEQARLREPDGALREVDADERSRLRPRPFQVIRAHADADLQHVAAAAVAEPGEPRNVRLQRVPRARLRVELFAERRPRGIDFAA